MSEPRTIGDRLLNSFNDFADAVRYATTRRNLGTGQPPATVNIEIKKGGISYGTVTVPAGSVDRTSAAVSAPPTPSIFNRVLGIIGSVLPGN